MSDSDKTPKQLIAELEAAHARISELEQLVESSTRHSSRGISSPAGATERSGIWFRNLLETIPDLVWLKDVEGIYLSCNPAFERLYGAKADKIIGKTDYDFADRDLADFFRLHDRNAMEAGKPTSNEEWLTFADTGYRGLFETIKTPMYDANGKLIGVLGIARDITNRKLAEEALEKRMVALTLPLDDSKGITFEELFNLDDIQRLQDEFAKATGVASIITHPDGTPITAPSGFCRLCNDIIRKTEKGLANCFKSDALIGRFSTSAPTIQPCMSGGLWDAGAGISVGGRHIANWLIGQVRDSTQTEEQIRKYAREIGANEDDMADAFREVPSMSLERFRSVAQALFTLANQLSAFAYQNVQQARFITDRKLAEEALRESEKSYRELFDNSPVGIFLTDSKGQAHRVNPELARILGAESPEDAIRRFKDLASQLYVDRERRKQFIAALREKGEVAHFEYEANRLDGGRIWLNMNARVRKMNPDGTFLIDGFTIDITERKRAEEELARQKSLLYSVIEGTTDAIFIKDLHGRYLLANSEVARSVGKPAEEIIGRDDTYLFPPAEAAEIMANDRLVMTSGKSQNYEEILTTTQGPRTYLCTKSPLRDEDGRITGMFGISRDITERTKVLELMVQTEKMMSVGGLAGGMAHEINNPLSGILQNVQVILRRLTMESLVNIQAAEEAGCSFDAVRRFMEKRDILASLEAVREAGRRAARIVASMLEFSRGSGSDKTPADINLLLDKSLELCATDYDLKKKYDFRNIRIIREYDPGLPLVPCSATQIQQVFLNLLTNAAQAMVQTPSPTVILRTSREDGKVLIEIEDNGPGMAADVRKRIFEPFFSTKPVGEGTGLGLSVSYFIIRNNHRGTIEAQSLPGSGARFVIRLPINQSTLLSADSLSLHS